MVDKDLIQGVQAAARGLDVTLNTSSAQRIVGGLSTEFEELRRSGSLPCQADGRELRSDADYIAAVAANLGAVHVLDQHSLLLAARYSGQNGASVQREDHVRRYESPIFLSGIGIS